MDIKFIGSGASAKGILHYITDYITKSQLKTHVVFAMLELAVKKLGYNSRPNTSTSGHGEDVQMSGTDSGELHSYLMLMRALTYSTLQLIPHAKLLTHILQICSMTTRDPTFPTKNPDLSSAKSGRKREPHCTAQVVWKSHRGCSLLGPGLTVDIHQQGPQPTVHGHQGEFSHLHFKFQLTQRQVYDINVEGITILDKGDGAPWNPPPPELASAIPSTSSKRARDPAVNSTFDSLSPSKKARTA
jgi:hypothetical protein